MNDRETWNKSNCCYSGILLLLFIRLRGDFSQISGRKEWRENDDGMTGRRSRKRNDQRNRTDMHMTAYIVYDMYR